MQNEVMPPAAAISERPDQVVISLKEYERLLDSEKQLNALEAGGVDNWEWYADSLKSYWESKENK